MSKQKPDCIPGRRTFLRGAVAAGGATALTAVTVTKLAAETLTNTQSEPITTPSSGYRETAHIRAYYDSSRV